MMLVWLCLCALDGPKRKDSTFDVFQEWLELYYAQIMD